MKRDGQRQRHGVPLWFRAGKMGRVVENNVAKNQDVPT